MKTIKGEFRFVNHCTSTKQLKIIVMSKKSPNILAQRFCPDRSFPTVLELNEMVQ